MKKVILLLTISSLMTSCLKSSLDPKKKIQLYEVNEYKELLRGRWSGIDSGPNFISGSNDSVSYSEDSFSPVIDPMQPWDNIIAIYSFSGNYQSSVVGLQQSDSTIIIEKQIIKPYNYSVSGIGKFRLTQDSVHIDWEYQMSSPTNDTTIIRYGVWSKKAPTY
jgi:hypothetical protein